MTEVDHTDEMLSPDAPATSRLPEILKRLRQEHPDAHCALDYETPLQLLLATILSAQTTDERVNEVTPVLFEKYPDTAAIASADRGELEEVIRSTGFYRQKARYLQETCQRLLEEHGGEVPGEMEALLQMTGVARKTANVVLGEIFGVADGVVVDTHVSRLSQRLGLTQETSATKIEQDLMALLPKEDWIDFSHLMIFHGRRVCHARTPDCARCVLNHLCPSAVT